MRKEVYSLENFRCRLQLGRIIKLSSISKIITHAKMYFYNFLKCICLNYKIYLVSTSKQTILCMEEAPWCCEWTNGIGCRIYGYFWKTPTYGADKSSASFSCGLKRCHNLHISDKNVESQVKWIISAAAVVEIAQSGFQCFRCSQGLFLLQKPALTQTGLDKPPSPKPPFFGLPWKWQWGKNFVSDGHFCNMFF